MDEKEKRAVHEVNHEWTVATVRGYLLRNSHNEAIHALADAHNAALAAAYERGKLEGVFASPDEGEINYVTGLEQQLAAEQEKVRHAEAMLQETDLAAKQLREQLAAAQAAIAKWKMVDYESDTPTVWLDAAIAAAQQPLVDALMWLDEFVVEPEYFPGDGDQQWWQEKRDSIRELAKVKEGK